MFAVLVLFICQCFLPTVSPSCLTEEQLTGKWQFSGISTWFDEWYPTELDLEIEILEGMSIRFYRDGLLEHETTAQLSCTTIEIASDPPDSDYGWVSGLDPEDCGPNSVFLFTEDLTPEGTHPCNGDLCLGVSQDGCTDSFNWIYEQLKPSVSSENTSWSALKSRY